jgi:hypothetical protein
MQHILAEGMRLLGRQQFAEAERSFRAAIDAASLVPAPHNNLALTAFVQGRIDEAIWNIPIPVFVDMRTNLPPRTSKLDTI